MHKYESWELFGRFLIHAQENHQDPHEIMDSFVRAWSVGDWSYLDEDWPEWSEFVSNQA